MSKLINDGENLVFQHEDASQSELSIQLLDYSLDKLRSGKMPTKEGISELNTLFNCLLDHIPYVDTSE